MVLKDGKTEAVNFNDNTPDEEVVLNLIKSLRISILH